MAKIIEPPIEETLKNFKLEPELLDKTAAEKAVESRDGLDGEGEEFQAELTTEEKEALAAEIVKIDAAVERLTERKEQIKQTLRDRLPYGTHTLHADAGVKVTMGHNRTLNKDRVREQFPFDLVVMEDQIVEGKRGKKEIVSVPTHPNAKLYKIEPDPTAIKKHLDEKVVVSLYDEGAARVTIR